MIRFNTLAEYSIVMRIGYGRQGEGCIRCVRLVCHSRPPVSTIFYVIVREIFMRDDPCSQHSSMLNGKRVRILSSCF